MGQAPKPRRQRPRALLTAGFTLMEILVAMVVLGFIMAGLAAGSRFGIAAWDAQSRAAARAAELDRVDHTLRMLIEQAAPPLAADDKPFAGQEHRIDFITRLPDQPQTTPVRRAEVAIGVDDKHRLLVRWQPHPNAVAIKPLPAPNELILATGVDHIDVSYRQALADGGNWKTRWDDNDVPALVQIHIVLQSTHRHWPVIQAAPMIDSNGSF